MLIDGLSTTSDAPPLRSPCFSADQQARAFLHQKLKVDYPSALPFRFLFSSPPPSSCLPPTADDAFAAQITATGPEERPRIDLRARWGDDDASVRSLPVFVHYADHPLVTLGFSKWAVQRCLKPPRALRNAVRSCGRIVDLGTIYYEYYVPQKALNSEEQEVFLLNVSELLRGISAMTLVNKHASLSPASSFTLVLSFYPLSGFAFALVPLRGFENLEESGKDGVVNGLLEHGAMVFGGVAKSELGSYCTQHILEHGSERSIAKCRSSTFPPGRTSRAARAWSRRSRRAEGDDGPRRAVNVQVGEGARRAMGVDVALSLTGCQLIASASLRLTTTSALYDPRTRTFTHMYHLSHTLLYQILKLLLPLFLVFSWRCCLTWDFSFSYPLL
ncbi:hypothetical protein B0H14DRAFT_3452346 [Mycena olivaceomarginata]|nr:hypothetical protein B0H14DRAFT_3452346 [Mycena olivaceomarginata]